jgi:hypothetical protein
MFAALLLALVLSGAFLPSRDGGYVPGVSSTSAAGVRYSKNIYYYDSPDFTNHVGTGTIYCNGSSTLEGTSTPYYQEEILDVCCYYAGGSVPC